MKIKKFLRGMFTLGVAVAGCESGIVEKPPEQLPEEGMPDEDKPGAPIAACSIPIPGAELTVQRTNGKPDTGMMKLPGLTSVCLKVETNAASATVNLDDIDVFTPSDFKNRDQVLERLVADLSGDSHTVSVSLAGKPDSHYIKVTAYYGTYSTQDSLIESVDEALLLGQAFVDFHADLTSFGNWKGGRAVRARPLHSDDGELQAYEIDVETLSGEDAGYVVLERNEMRPLLGAAWSEGPALSDILFTKYEFTYGEPATNAPSHQFLWAGVGIMSLEATLADATKRITSICEPFECPGVSFAGADRAIANYPALGLSAEEWIEQRRTAVAAMLDAFVMSGMMDGAVHPWSPPVSIPVPKSEANTEPQLSNGQDEPVLAGCAPGVRPRENFIPGEGSKVDLTLLSPYYQEYCEWDKPECGEPECAAGCVPVAAAILLDYWDRRYEYLVDGAGNKDVTDPDVYKSIAGLRDALMTTCTEDKSGSTLNVNVAAFLPGYIDGVAGADVGWTAKWLACGKSDSSKQRQDVIWPEVDRGHPSIIFYHSDQTLICEDVDSEPGTTHAGVVYGYIDDGRSDWFADEVIVAKGWKDTRVQVLPIDAIGKVQITTVSPGCWVPDNDSNDPCMTFSDIPNDHWGKESVETLSCMCVVRGYPDGTFDLDDTVTKAEFLKMIVRIAFYSGDVDFDGIRVSNPKIGICADHWASGYIDFALKNGMLGAPMLTNGAFLADAPLSRQEAAYLLAKVGESGSPMPHIDKMHKEYECFLDLPADSPYKKNPYTDEVPLAAAYLSAVLATTSYCVFEGYLTNPLDPDSDREFRAKQHITRIEAAKVACVARFGSDSKKCDQDHVCKPLSDCPDFP